MKKINEIKTKTYEELETENFLLQQKIDELSTKIDYIEEKYRLALQKKYGSSSEKIIEGQLSIFNEAEEEENQVQEQQENNEPIIEEISYKRKKISGHKKEMFSNLPYEIIEYKLSEDEQVCSCCKEKMHEIRTETREELKIIPAQLKILKHVKYIYGCRNCEKNEIVTPIITAKMPIPALPKSMAGSSIISQVMSQKFVDAMPLYRQEQNFRRFGVEISRQTMANWMIKASEKWLEIIYKRMQEYMVKKDILHADETELQVLHEEGRAANTKSYMWLYRTGREGPPIVLYDYQTTRAGKHPAKFLKKFKGYLHVDGYPGYHGLPNIVLVGCWAHARRKFYEALKAMPTNRKNTTMSICEEGLNYCNELFKFEREFKALTSEERYIKRIEKSKKILDLFLNWLKKYESKVLNKSALGQAIHYCLNQWDKLIAFLDDGRLELDNNRSERTIKPFVIGRKNWLFSNTARGARSSSVIYSIIETAKENNLNPFFYLNYLFDQLPNLDIKEENILDSLLPWSENIPASCKVKI